MLIHYTRIRTFYNIYLLSLTLSFDKMVAHRLFCFGCQLIRNVVLLQAQQRHYRSPSHTRLWYGTTKEIGGTTRAVKRTWNNSKRHFLVAIILQRKSHKLNYLLIAMNWKDTGTAWKHDSISQEHAIVSGKLYLGVTYFVFEASSAISGLVAEHGQGHSSIFIPNILFGLNFIYFAW